MATRLVNEVVNRAGTSFVFRAVEETGAPVAEVIRAYVIVREVYGLTELWRAIEALNGSITVQAQVAVQLANRRLLDRAVRWLVVNRRLPLDVPAEIARLRPGVTRLRPDLGRLSRGRERAAIAAKEDALVSMGLPPATAAATTR